MQFLTNFCFCCLCFCCHIHEMTIKTNGKQFIPFVFFQDFYSFRLMFKSLIYFIVSGVRYCSNFILSYMDIEVSHYHLFKRRTFPIEYSWLSCQALADIYAWVCFWADDSVSLVYVSVFMQVLQCFDYYTFVIWKSEICLQLCSFLVFVYSGYFGFHANFKIVYFISVKNAFGILTVFALNLQMALGGMDISMILALLICEHGIFSHLFVSSSIFFINVIQFSVCVCVCVCIFILVKFTPRYFIAFDAALNRIVFFLFQIVYCWCIEMQPIFYVDFFFFFFLALFGMQDPSSHTRDRTHTPTVETQES